MNGKLSLFPSMAQRLLLLQTRHWPGGLIRSGPSRRHGAGQGGAGYCRSHSVAHVPAIRGLPLHAHPTLCPQYTPCTPHSALAPCPHHQGECTGATMPCHSWVTAATRPLSTRKPPCPHERDMLTGHQPPPGKGELWPCADLGQHGSAGRKAPQAASTPAPHPAKQSQFRPGGWSRDSQSGASRDTQSAKAGASLSRWQDGETKGSSALLATREGYQPF